MPPSVAIVLAGGGSTRMGGIDKAALDVAGTTMLDRVLAAARPVSDRLVVVGPMRATTVCGVEFVCEPEPGGGPVPAVAAGLAASGDADAVLILAADLPLLSTAGLQRLLDRLAADPPVDAAAALDHRRLPNPLLAAYRGHVLRPGSGPGSPAAALLPDRLATVDLGPEATLNANRPVDVERAVAVLGSRSAEPESRSASPLPGADRARLGGQDDEPIPAGMVLGPGRPAGGRDAMASSYPDRYADALGGPRLTEAEVDALLELARAVAHGTERRHAPLSTYLAGRFVARRTAAGVALEEALAEAVVLGERSIGENPPPAV